LENLYIVIATVFSVDMLGLDKGNIIGIIILCKSIACGILCIGAGLCRFTDYIPDSCLVQRTELGLSKGETALIIAKGEDRLKAIEVLVEFIENLQE